MGGQCTQLLLDAPDAQAFERSRQFQIAGEEVLE